MPETESNRGRSALASISLVLIALVALAGVLYLVTQRRVTVFADGRSISVTGHETHVGQLLETAGVALQPGDLVSPEPGSAVRDGMEVAVTRAQLVTVAADGRLITRRTSATTLSELFDQVGVALGPDDIVLGDGAQVWPPLLDEPAAEASPSPPRSALNPAGVLPSRLEVYRSCAISVIDGDRTLDLETTAETVGAALQEAGVIIYLGDQVTPSLDSPVESGLEVTLLRSISVSVEVDGTVLHSRTHHTRVAAVLGDLGVALVGQDYAIPGPEEEVQPNSTIRVVRVREEIVIQQEPIPFDYAWQPDPNLEIDQQQVVQSGRPGILQRRYRVRYEDGQEVSEVLEDEWVAQEPATHITAYGTKVVVRTAQMPEGPIEYWRKIRVLATSYTAATSGKERDHPAYGITAVGWEMRPGIIAVDPRLINLFQEVYVPGYGFAVAADTGGAIKGRRIDLGYDEGNLVLWYQWVDLYLLTPAPSPDKIRYILPELPD